MAVLKKVKERLSKPIKIRKLNRRSKTSLGQDKKDKPYAPSYQLAAETAKFYTHELPRPQAQARRMHEDLPYEYGQDKIVLQVRDPWWLHAYWEVTPSRWQRLREEFRAEIDRARRVLRVYDVSSIIFNGSNAHCFFDIAINDLANNWYIDTQGPGRSWCVDLGLVLPGGRFITIVRSNTVHTPLDAPSWVTDEKWMIPDEMFARLYGSSLGFGSSQVKPKKLWEQALKHQVSSGAISSASSPVKKPQGKGFWLAVNTELIVYGATVPDAKVTAQGKPVSLRPDGTFSLRFALPDGKQVIPVEAVSLDNKEKRAVTPIVTKETK